MNGYLLLLTGRTPLDYSPAALQHRLERYREWVRTLGELHEGGERLERAGALIDGDVIETDGPFLEPTEIIAGFIRIRARTLEHAIEIASGCPLRTWFRIEVRPLVAEEPGGD